MLKGWIAARTAVVISLAACVVLAQPASAEDARQILAGSLQPKDTTYVGEQVTEITLPGSQNARRQVQTVYRSGSRLRIEYRTGQVLFDDGATQLFYLPRQRRADREPSKLSGVRPKVLNNVVKNRRVTVELLPDDTVAGRPTYVLQVKPPRGQGARVWIDKATLVQLRRDERHPNGRLLSTYFTSIDFDAEPPASKLAFVPPAGTEIVDRRPVPLERAARVARAWGGLLAPGFLPPGLRLRGYFDHQFRNRRGLVAVFVGPGDRVLLSVFQGPSMAMGNLTAMQPGNLRVLTARKGSADVTLVSSLPQEDLQKVMDSMQAAQ